MALRVLLLALFLAFAATNDTLIFTISTSVQTATETTHAGSLAGGTMIFVDGTNLMGTDPSLIQIYIGSQLCVFDHFLMAASYIECTVPAPNPAPFEPADILNLPITTLYNGLSLSISSAANPVYSYLWSKTPIIYAVGPAQESSFHNIAFYGTWLTEGDSSLYQEIRVANKHNTFLDRYSTYQSYGSTFIASTLGDNLAGDGSPSVRLAAAVGFALFYWTGLQYTLSGEPYFFQALAEVNALSSNSGSQAGGLTLTITGSGFPQDTSLITASIEGNACKVTSASYYTVVCVTGSETLKETGPTYEGASGLRHHLWYFQTIANASNILDSDADVADIVPLAEAFPLDNNRIDDSFVERWKGFFKAPRDGSYTFYTSSDDGCQVWIAPDKDPIGKVLVINFNSYTNYRDMLTRASTRSSPILMHQGELHYIEIWHQQWGGLSHFSLGVQIPSPGSPRGNNMPSLQLVSIQPTIIRGVQSVLISGAPTGGQIIFTYKGVSATVNWPSSGASWSCGDISYAMKAFDIQSLGCKMTVLSDAKKATIGVTYDFTFNYAYTDNRGYIAASLAAATPSGLQVTYTSVPASPPLTGTYKLQWQTMTTGDIPVTTSAASLQNTLNSNFKSIFNNTLLVYGSANADSVQLQFLFGNILNPTGTVPLIQILSSAAGGDPATEPVATVTEIIQGSTNQFWWSAPNEFFRTIETSPTLHVEVNSAPAICRGNCAFQYSTNSPTITSVTYASTVSMIGVHLPGSLACDMISVSIGGADCPVVTCSITTITCTQQVGVVGSFKPQVLIAGSGLALLDPAVTATTYSLAITSVSPTAGSVGGGTLLTIIGTGFLPVLPYANYVQTVTVGTSPCDVQTSTGSSITCLTSPQTTDSLVTVSVNTFSATSSDFAYDASMSPTITSVSPTYASTIVKTIVTITGTNLDRIASGSVTVFVGKVECYVTHSTSTSITCDLLGGPTGKWLLVVSIPGRGNAVQKNFPLVFSIASVTPSVGSTQGGTLLTIAGQGLSTRASQLFIMFSDQNHVCSIVGNPTDTQVKCITPPVDVLPPDVPQTIYLLGRIQEEAICTGTCSFTFSSSITPSITSISTNIGPAGTSLNIIGTGFGTILGQTTVLFGAQAASVTSVTSSQVTVVVPNQVAGTYSITLTFSDIGTAAGGFTFTQTVDVTSVSPLTGSQGGTQVTIQGTGFASNAVVSFGGVKCVQTTISLTSIQCQVALSISTPSQWLAITQTAGSYTCSSAAFCGFSYTAGLTPKITSVTPSGTTLTIAGSGFSNTLSDVQVTAGGVTCSVTAASLNSITSTCAPPSGVNSVSVFVNAKGFATGGPFSITTPLTASGASGSGSFGGGSSITLTGSGLGPNTTITVCQFPCPVVTATYSSLTCTAPSLPSDYSQPHYSLTPITNKIKTGFTGSQPVTGFPLSNLFDSNFTTYYKSAQANCFLQFDAGAGRLLLLGGVIMYPAEDSISTYKSIVGATLTMSNDAVTWTPVHTFSVMFAGWNFWYVPVNQVPADNYPVFKARYFQILFPSNSQCKVAEIYFEGVITQTDSNPTLACNVIAQDSVTSSSINAGSFTYSSTSTPTVTSISPTTGTTLGGTVLTFNGNQLGAVSQVKIDGVQCELGTQSSTSFTCTTGARNALVPPSIVITTASGLAVLNGVKFLYADRWSASTTWGGEVPPKVGESVHIPVGQTILLDIPTPILELVLIEGSLIVEDVPGITLEATYIFVNYGLFQVGTEASPFQNEFTIVLHGLIESHMMPIYGNTVLASHCGVLDLHGVPRSVTWTSLVNTISKGDNTFTVQVATDWKEGETIVVAPTSYDYTEGETRVITSVVGGTQFTVDKPFNFKHYAATETYGSNTIDMRAEVGLLTRNVKIRGGSEGIYQQHGAHVMSYCPGDEGVIARVSYIEVFNAGQAFSVGAYPFHFHMCGTVRNSYIVGNSVHDTYNRAITIHGISYLRVTDNVTYKTMGHTIFVEDGIETKNRIMNNLVISVSLSWSRLNTDTTPAGIWVTHPNNYVTGNHVAGSQAFGIWFNFNPHPTGPSATTLICPYGEPLGEFSNNVVHSNVRFGFWLFHSHIPKTFPCNPTMNTTATDPWADNPPVPAVYDSITSYKNGLDGINIERAGYVSITNSKVADNIEAGIQWTYTIDTNPYTIPFLSNILIVGNSLNAEPDVDMSGCIGFLGPQSDGMLAVGLSFYNFDSNMYTLGDESHSQNCHTRSIGGRRIQLKGLTFVNANKLVHWEIPHRSFFEILDASMTGHAGAFIAAFWPHLLWEPHCVLDLATYNGIVCDGTKVLRRVHMLNMQPALTFFLMQITVRRAAGDNIPLSSNATLGTGGLDYWWTSMDTSFGAQFWGIPKSWAVPMIMGTEFSVHWGTTPMDWTYMEINIDSFDDPSQWVLVHYNFTDHRENFTVNRGTLPPGTNKTAPNFVDPTLIPSQVSLTSSSVAGSSNFDNVTAKEFDIMLNGQPVALANSGTIVVNAYRCWGGHCTLQTVSDNVTMEAFTRVWSNSNSWPSGVVPVDGDSVTILPNWTMILDTNTAILSFLEVDGTLIFDNTTSVTLNSYIIHVRRGKIQSGSAGYPLPPNLTHQIVLHGTFNSTAYAFDPNIDVVNKAFIVTGEMNLFGARRKSWVHLVENAYPGDQDIYVERVNWQPGDDIVLASSSFYANETDTATISSVTGSIDLVTGLDNGVSLAGDSNWQNKENTKSYGLFTSQMYPAQYATVNPATISKLHLTKPLLYYHAGTIPLVNGSPIDMRAEVGVLTSNIYIRGTWNGWACNFVVANFIDYSIINENPILRTGTVTLDSVAFDYCGQNSTTRAGLRFVGTTLPSVVTNSIVKRSDTYAVYVVGASNLQLINNTFFPAVRWGVLIQQSNNLFLTGNLMVNVTQRPSINIQLDKPTGFVICPEGRSACNNVVVARNVAAGYAMIGFADGGYPCGSTPTFYDNVAHSGIGGWITSNIGASCMEMSGFTTYFNQETAVIGSMDIAQMTLSNLKVAESFNGYAGNMGGEADYGNVVTIKDSWFIGRTEHSKCDPTVCWTSACGNRRGIVLGGYQQTAKQWLLYTKLKLPIYNITSDSVFHAEFRYDNLVFMNYQSTDTCQANITAISSNELNADYHPMQVFSNIQLINVGADSIFHMSDPDPVWVNQVFCGEFECTGLYNVVVKDLDGSLVGGNLGGYLFANNPGIVSENICTFVKRSNGYICSKTQIDNYDYGILMFENLDIDSRNVTISPINVTSLDTVLDPSSNHFYNKLNSFISIVWDGFYVGYDRMARFPTVVGLNRQVNITFTGTLPVDMRYQLQAFNQDTDGVFITIPYRHPLSVQVKLNGTVVAPLPYGQFVNQSSPSGTNQWIFADRLIQFMIRSNDIIELIQLNCIQLSVRMNMTIKEFFAKNGPTEFVDRLAACLGIPSYRIRVVDVQSGSTICNTVVDSNPTLAGQSPKNSNFSSAQQEELFALNSLLVELASNGSLVLNAPILNLTSSVVSPLANNDTANITGTPVTIIPQGSQGSTTTTNQIIPSDNTSAFFNWWVYMLLGIGCFMVIAIILVYALVLHYCYKRMHRPQVSSIQVHPDVMFEKVESPKNPSPGDPMEIQDLDVLGTGSAEQTNLRRYSQIQTDKTRPMESPQRAKAW